MNKSKIIADITNIDDSGKRLLLEDGTVIYYNQQENNNNCTVDEDDCSIEKADAYRLFVTGSIIK